MADTKISALTALTGADAATDDVYPVVDTSLTITKKQTRAELFKGVPNLEVDGGAAVGYVTGSGGTVTQTTSRTTGVTINAPSGQITLVSAAGTTSWQTFTVTNNTVAATDVVILSQKSGTDLHMLHCTAVGAGSFNISFATTGGTTTEQPVISFAVIKGASS